MNHIANLIDAIIKSAFCKKDMRTDDQRLTESIRAQVAALESKRLRVRSTVLPQYRNSNK
jgi:hypothetical protein